VISGSVMSSSLVLGVQHVNQILQRRQFLLVNQAELFNEEDEVFERRVEVRFLVQSSHVVAVLMVDVSVDAKQPLQDRLRHRQKVPREWNACAKHHTHNATCWM